MKIVVRKVEKQKDRTFYEVVINNIGLLVRQTQQDLINTRSNLEDFLTNTALDLAEKKGFARENIKVILEGEL